MEHLKKSVAQWQMLNDKYQKETQQHFQRLGAVLRSFWTLDMKKNSDDIRESIEVLGMIYLINLYLHAI